METGYRYSREPFEMGKANISTHALPMNYSGYKVIAKNCTLFKKVASKNY